MNPQQKKTTIKVAAGCVALFVLGVFFLVVELQAVAQGGNSTISEMVWRLWATQPWVILLVSHVIVGPICFLAGHFTSQSQAVYAALRREAVQEEGKGQ